jgi:hypothetical protein
MKKAVFALAASALGDDFSQGKGAKATANWKVLSLGAVPDSRTTKGARAFADGIGFAFGTTPDTKLLLTSRPGQRPPRRLDRQDADGDVHDHRHGHRVHLLRGEPAGVRLRPPRIGAPVLRGQHHRPLHVRKAMVVEPAGVHPDEPGRQYPHVDGSARHGELDQQGLPARFGSTDFAAAVATVGAVGVSFGGGCFLPTGAVPTDGTASFVLKSYSVS